MLTPDDGVLAGLQAHPPLRERRDELRLHVAGVDGGHGAAHLGDLGHLGARTLDDGGDLGLHDVRAREDVVVVEQVGLVGQHLLHPQRPLLVPRPRQAQRLVPRRQLHRAGPGVLRQRHREHLQHDALDVVLRLGLGEPQRVDLHAVAEAPHLGVLDAVALAAQLVPELRERPQLRDLLDEVQARVDEERDAPDDLAEVVLGHLARVAHGVEHRDRRRQRVGDLLRRRRPGLLQVVAADVDRVPLGDVRVRPGDHVGDQPDARPGRERVGPAREVLLDDVVLRGARELRAVGALLVGDGDVEREHPHRRRVDRHRGVGLVERDLVEQRPHVPDVRHGHADLADLALGELGVGVVPGLRGQVERDRQAGLPLLQVPPVELVRRARRRVAGVGPHDPGPVAGVVAGVGHVGPPHRVTWRMTR